MQLILNMLTSLGMWYGRLTIQRRRRPDGAVGLGVIDLQYCKAPVWVLITEGERDDWISSGDQEMKLPHAGIALGVHQVCSARLCLPVADSRLSLGFYRRWSRHADQSRPRQFGRDTFTTLL